jgi:hypothetical protein
VTANISFFLFFFAHAPGVRVSGVRLERLPAARTRDARQAEPLPALPDAASGRPGRGNRRRREGWRR